MVFFLNVSLRLYQLKVFPHSLDPDKFPSGYFLLLIATGYCSFSFSAKVPFHFVLNDIASFWVWKLFVDHRRRRCHCSCERYLRMPKAIECLSLFEAIFLNFYEGGSRRSWLEVQRHLWVWAWYGFKVTENDRFNAWKCTSYKLVEATNETSSEKYDLTRSTSQPTFLTLTCAKFAAIAACNLSFTE